MDHLSFFCELAREHRSVDLIGYPSAGPRRGWLVNHPRLVQHVMVHQERRYAHPPHPFAASAPVLVDTGAFLLGLARAREQRDAGDHRRLQAAIAASISAGFARLEARLRRRVRADPRIEIVEELAETWFEIICELLFGREPREHEAKAFVFASTTLERARLDPHGVDPAELATAIATCERIAASIAKTGAAELGVGTIMPTIFNGYGALSTSLAWTLALLARHGEVLAELEREVLDGVSGELATLDLARAPFARMVVLEALRLYPPAWLLQRRALEADEIAGHSIAPDDLLSICLFTLHRDPRFWHEPETFAPARFSPDRPQTRPKHSYLPFGAGRRVCPAERIGVAMVQRALIALTRGFELAAAGPPPRPCGLIALRPEPGVILELTPRGP